MKTAVLIVICLIACFGGLILGSLAWQTLHLPQSFWITESSAYTMYVEDTEWINTTTLDWGGLEADNSYYVNFTVQNIGDTTDTVSLIIPYLPVNCTETWTGNNTLLAPTETVIGNLTLTIGTVAAGNYSFDAYIKLG